MNFASSAKAKLLKKTLVMEVGGLNSHSVSTIPWAKHVERVVETWLRPVSTSAHGGLVIGT